MKMRDTNGISSKQDPEMDAVVSMIGARYEKIPSIPELKMVQVYPKYFIDDSSNFVQVSNMTRLGGRLPTSFLSQVYGIAHEVRVEIDPVSEIFRAKRMVNERLYSVSESIAYRQSKELAGWSGSGDTEG